MIRRLLIALALCAALSLPALAGPKKNAACVNRGIQNAQNWVNAKTAKTAPQNVVYEGRAGAFRAAKADAGIPLTQNPKEVRHVPMTDKWGAVQQDGKGKIIMTREYVFVRPSDGREIVIQEHSVGHQFGAPGNVGDQGPHFNVRPAEDTRNGSIEGAKDHYEFKKGD